MASVIFVLMYMNPAPARMPKVLLMMVRQGIVISAARYFGASTNSIGSRAMVRSASISLVTTMVPISAENADPDRPLTTMAVNSGPSSRVNPIATVSMTYCSAPNLRSSDPACIARMNPAHTDMIPTIGSASTPIAAIWRIAARQRPRLPTNGSTRGEAHSPDQN